MTKCRRVSSVGVVLAWLCGGAGCLGDSYSLGIDCLKGGTEKELQAAANSSTEVLLCPRALFTLQTPVLLRAGSTVETYLRPSDPTQMATIRLGEGFTGQNVGLGALVSDITIASVRFDGNRRMLGPKDNLALLYLGPGHNYHVIGNVFTDTPGWTHLHVVEPCDSATVTGNTIETGSLTHDANLHYADGLSISCANSIIADNVVNDISGVGIVYYGGPGTVIRHNTVVESTTSASSGINVGDAVRMDHTGVIISDNIIRSVAPSYFHIGIAAGLRVWPNRLKDITGVTISGNVISGMLRYGLAVDGCDNCVVQDNVVANWQPVMPQTGCPASAPYVANVTAGHATAGVLQTGYVDANIDGCVGLALTQ